MNKKKIIFTSLVIMLILLVTLMSSVAYFSYAKKGLKENSIELGDITFKYTENNRKGNGINIEDAFPISDSEGKELNDYFEFTIDSKLSRSDIKYEVVVEPTSDSTINLDGIKFYLTEVDNNIEKIPSTMNSEGETTTLVSSIKDNGKVKVLSEYSNTEIENLTGKTVYQEVILKNTKNYSKTFRARMWVSEDIDWTDEGYIGTRGSFRVNVYANSDISMARSDTTGPSDTRLERIVLNNKYLLEESSSENIDYEVTVPNEVEEVEFNVYETNTKATSTVTRISSVSYSGETKVVPISNEINDFSLNVDENYFKVIVTGSNGVTTQEYKLKVVRERNHDNNLLNLGITGYSLQPTFDKDTTSYTITLEEPSIEITGTPSSDVATISGTGQKDLVFGDNTFTVTVTAQDLTTKDYTITVTNERPTAPTITGGTGSSTWTNSAPTITLAEDGEGFAISGIANYEYYTSTSSTLPTDDTVATGTLTVANPSIQITNEGTTYVYFRTVSNKGFKSVWSSPQIVNLETSLASVPTFSNKKSSLETVTLNYNADETKSGVNSVTCYYGDTNTSVTSIGTANMENKTCTYPSTATYAKVCYTKNIGTSNCSSVKQLATWIVKNGNTSISFTATGGATMTKNTGYINIKNASSGTSRAGIYSNNYYNFSSYGYGYVDASYTLSSISSCSSGFTGACADGHWHWLMSSGNLMVLNSTPTTFAKIAPSFAKDFTGTKSFSRTVYGNSIDGTGLTSARYEFLRNSSYAIYNINLYNMWFQLKN